MVHTSEHLEHTAHRAVEAQGRFARRLGETIELPNDTEDGFDTWRIHDVVRGDDHAPVLLRKEGGVRSVAMPALRLERFESAARGHTANEHAPQVISVVDIESEMDRDERIEQVLGKLLSQNRDGAIASTFSKEIARVVRSVCE